MLHNKAMRECNLFIQITFKFIWFLFQLASCFLLNSFIFCLFVTYTIELSTKSNSNENENGININFFICLTNNNNNDNKCRGFETIDTSILLLISTDVIDYNCYDISLFDSPSQDLLHLLIQHQKKKKLHSE